MGADAPNMGLWVRPENIAIHKYLIQIAWYEISSLFLAGFYTKDIKI